MNSKISDLSLVRDATEESGILVDYTKNGITSKRKNDKKIVVFLQPGYVPYLYQEANLDRMLIKTFKDRYISFSVDNFIRCSGITVLLAPKDDV